MAAHQIHRLKLLVAFVGMALLFGLNPIAQASRLTPGAVAKIADLAAKRASYDGLSFTTVQKPDFDKVTRVWRVDFRGVRVPEFGHNMVFSVFVYDATLRTEVGCPGIDLEGVAPAEVEPFVKDERLMELVCADLNGDGLPDYLLVTDNYLLAAANQKALLQRQMQVLVRNPDGTLKSVAINSKALQSVDGIGGYFQVHARKNNFSITNVLAGMKMDGDRHDFYFEYSQSAGTWVLTRVELTVLGANYHDEHDRTWLPKDFGLVRFSEFNLRQYESE